MQNGRQCQTGRGTKEINRRLICAIIQNIGSYCDQANLCEPVEVRQQQFGK